MTAIEAPRLPVPGWCLVQRRGGSIALAGYVEEVELAGARYLELRPPDGQGGFRRSLFLNAATDVASVIGTDEETATAKAVRQWSGKG